MLEHATLPLVTPETELFMLPDGSNNPSPSLPGFPLIPLSDSFAMHQRLSGDLSTARLRRIYRLLFLTARPGNVSPLHHQAIKGRRVLITERADLHLVWYYESIYVKPVPKYLLSAWFWQVLTAPCPAGLRSHGTKEERALWDPAVVEGHGDDDGDNLPRLEALGLLRSYGRLIRHESDLAIALNLGLLPPDTTWSSWCRFIAPFTALRDREVSPRYHYGEIRLTRLNALYSLLLLDGGSAYAETRHSYASFFAQFAAPYLFLFGAVTVLLTGIQTGLDLLAVREYGDGTDDIPYGAYWRLATGFVPFALLLTVVGLALLPMLMLIFPLMETLRFFRRYQPLV